MVSFDDKGATNAGYQRRKSVADRHSERVCAPVGAGVRQAVLQRIRCYLTIRLLTT